MVTVKVSGRNTAAYPGPDTPRVTDRFSTVSISDPDSVVSINPAEVVLGDEANDIKLVLSKRWGLSMVGETDPM
jgi:hypothetical protein